MFMLITVFSLLCNANVEYFVLTFLNKSHES